MHHGQNSGKQETGINHKKRKWNENRGKFVHFAEIGGEIFVEIGEYEVCIIVLGGWMLLPRSGTNC